MWRQVQRTVVQFGVGGITLVVLAGFVAQLNITDGLMQVLVMLLVGSVIIERIIPNPRDVMANAIASTILVTASLRHIESPFSYFGYGIIAYGILVFSLAALGLMSHSPISRIQANKAAEYSRRASKWAITLGQAKVIYFLAALPFFGSLVEKNPWQIAALFFMWFFVGWLDSLFEAYQTMLQHRTGLPIAAALGSAASPQQVSLLLGPRTGLMLHDLVRLIPPGQTQRCWYGYITNLSLSNTDSLGTADTLILGREPDGRPMSVQLNSFGLEQPLSLPDPDVRVEKVLDVPGDVRFAPLTAEQIVGHVIEGSTVEHLRLKVIDGKDVRVGDVLCGYNVSDPAPTLYQVTNICTASDDTNKMTGYRVAIASQIGIYLKGEFRRSMMVPGLHTPVTLPVAPSTAHESAIWRLEGTHLHVPCDVNSLIVYHTALLGVTGSGKSTLSRQLVNLIAGSGIKVLVLDSHDEYAPAGSTVITMQQPNIVEALKAYVASSSWVDTEESASDIRERIQAEEFKHLPDLEAFLDRLSTTKEDKSRKRLLEKFYEDYYSSTYLPSQVVDADAKGLPDMLEQFLGDETKVLVVKLHLLDTDDQRRVVARLARDIYTWGVRQGPTRLDKVSKDPVARLAIILEEAHVFVPESGYNLGTDAQAKRNCMAWLTNLALRGRKYGIGTVAISQRAAFVDKGLLSQANTLFALTTVSKNDKDVLRDFLDEERLGGVSLLERGQVYFMGKGSKVRSPLLVRLIDDRADSTG